MYIFSYILIASFKFKLSADTKKYIMPTLLHPLCQKSCAYSTDITFVERSWYTGYQGQMKMDQWIPWSKISFCGLYELFARNSRRNNNIYLYEEACTNSLRDIRSKARRFLFHQVWNYLKKLPIPSSIRGHHNMSIFQEKMWFIVLAKTTSQVISTTV